MREYVSIAEETSKAARSDQKAALPYRGLNLCNIDTSQTSLTLALTQRDIDANHIVDGIREQIGKKGRPAMIVTNALYAEIDRLKAENKRLREALKNIAEDDMAACDSCDAYQEAAREAMKEASHEG